MVSPHILQLLIAAYQAGWIERGQLERDIQEGNVEKPPDDANVDPAAFIAELLKSRG